MTFVMFLSVSLSFVLDLNGARPVLLGDIRSSEYGVIINELSRTNNNIPKLQQVTLPTVLCMFYFPHVKLVKRVKGDPK